MSLGYLVGQNKFKIPVDALLPKAALHPLPFQLDVPLMKGKGSASPSSRLDITQKRADTQIR